MHHNFLISTFIISGAKRCLVYPSSHSKQTTAKILLCFLSYKITDLFSSEFTPRTEEGDHSNPALKLDPLFFALLAARVSSKALPLLWE